MKTTIKKTYQFSAAHWIPTLPEGHRCRNMHGHTYSAEVEVDGFRGVNGYREDKGMVLDFGELDGSMTPIIAALDHSTLNNISKLDIPTVESISRYIFSLLDGLGYSVVSVVVREGNGGSAQTTK
jgi:6-pyruvoyltetrahydropterin/6-carboxytetrahydropterin synthase